MSKCLKIFLVSMGSISFKFCWNSEYVVIQSISVLKVISSQVHPSSKPSFDIFVAAAATAAVVVM